MFFILVLFTVSGLTCWVCENAKDNDDCNKRGKLQQCATNEVSNQCPMLVYQSFKIKIEDENLKMERIL